MENKEIEVRFLEINKEKLVKKLRDMEAIDKAATKKETYISR